MSDIFSYTGLMALATACVIGVLMLALWGGGGSPLAAALLKKHQDSSPWGQLKCFGSSSVELQCSIVAKMAVRMLSVSSRFAFTAWR